MNICVVGGKDFKLLPKPLGETPEIFQSLYLNYISKIMRTVWRAIIRNMSEWMQFSGKVPHTFLANTLLYWGNLGCTFFTWIRQDFFIISFHNYVKIMPAYINDVVMASVITWATYLHSTFWYFLHDSFACLWTVKEFKPTWIQILYHFSECVPGVLELGEL